MNEVYILWENKHGFSGERVKIIRSSGQRLFLDKNTLGRKWVEKKMLGLAADRNTNKRHGISIVDVNQEMAKKNLIKYLEEKIKTKEKEIIKLNKYIKVLEE